MVCNCLFNSSSAANILFSITNYLRTKYLVILSSVVSTLLAGFVHVVSLVTTL